MKDFILKKFPFILLGIIAFILAFATIIEKQYGTHTALEQVYTSWWMILLWGIMAISGFTRCLQIRLWKRPTLLLLHMSFVVILLGALTTHLTSKRGYIHLRSGETTRCFTDSERRLHPMPFYLCLDSFDIKVDKGEKIPTDYVSSVMIHDNLGDTHLNISMNHPARKAGYRIYQTSYDDDLKGSIFTVMYDPWGIGITYLGYAMLALSMITLSVKRTSTSKPNYKKRKHELFGWIIGTFFASYMVVALLIQPLMPVLRSPMLVIHVGTIMISYCLLLVSFFNRNLLRPAVFTLAAGIFLGAMWANISWGTYWSWDPKETWAIITLIIYAIPLHTQSLPWIRSDKNYRLYSIFAFFCLAMTYFGVNYFLGGMHSYLN